MLEAMLMQILEAEQKLEVMQEAMLKVTHLIQDAVKNAKRHSKYLNVFFLV